LRGLRTGAWWEIGSCGDVAGNGLLDHHHRAMILIMMYIQQRGRDHARHLLKITNYTHSCKTRGVSRALLRKCVACRSHHHVRLSALPAIIVRQRWNCSRSYMRLLPTCISRWRLWDFRHSWSEPVASSHHSDRSLRAGTVQRWPRDLAHRLFREPIWSR
jgi:hypothetical protein